jgi:hypothetical protein
VGPRASVDAVAKREESLSGIEPRSLVTILTVVTAVLRSLSEMEFLLQYKQSELRAVGGPDTMALHRAQGFTCPKLTRVFPRYCH